MSDPTPPGEQQYFAAKPQVASHESQIVLSLPDARFELTTDRGVFSASRVDTGTRVLLLDAPPPPQGAVHLVDLGCGYGPIALTMARRSPEATVWAVDVNERALELCARNAQRAGLADRIHTCTPDAVPPEIPIAGIWSNPPIRIGKPSLHLLLATWIDRLEVGGEAVLVVQKHLGSDSLARWLTERGDRVDRLVARAGYRLLVVHHDARHEAEIAPPTEDLQ